MALYALAMVVFARLYLGYSKQLLRPRSVPYIPSEMPVCALVPKANYNSLEQFTKVAPHILEAEGYETAPALSFGLAFIKVPKVGGSSWGGALRRMGTRNGLAHTSDAYWLDTDDVSNEAAPLWANHGERSELAPALESAMPNALFVTLVRHPVERAMSSFYFSEVGRHGLPPTVENKIEFLETVEDSFQFDYIRANDSTNPTEVMASYNFIGVTERFDESLLLLSKALGVSFVDMLYLSAKESGKAATDPHDTGVEPEHPPFANEPAEVQKAAMRLEVKTARDMQLYDLANDALDQAIREYGPSFKNDLANFTSTLKSIESACRSEFAEDCLWNDNGCGQTCIDDEVNKLFSLA